MRTLIILSALLLTCSLCSAQNNFPVNVTNLPGAIPAEAYQGGSKNNAYTVQTVTKSQIDAAPNTSIGHLYSLNAGFGPQPAKAALVYGFWIKSSKPAPFLINIGQATGVLNSTNIPTMSVSGVADATTQYYPVNWIMRNMKSVFLYCLGFLNSEDTSTVITFTPNVTYVTDDFNYKAKHTLMWIGTSITNGSGPTATGYMYHFLVKDYLRQRGISCRNELYGISGSTSLNHYTLFKQGSYDVDMKENPPSAVFLEMAVNDASAGLTASSYKARLKEYALRYLTNPERKDVKVVFLGPTPLENTTAHDNGQNLQAAAVELVNELKILYPARVFTIPLSSSYTRTDATRYASTDTNGQRIHPNDAGHADIFTNGFMPWFNSAEGISFINGLK